MHEEIMYPVCPYRNVPAAFQRFLGPDSGGIERFFPEEHARRTDGTLLIVRMRGKSALAGAGRVLVQLNGTVSAFAALAAAYGAQTLRRGRDAAYGMARWATLALALRHSRLPV